MGGMPPPAPQPQSLPPQAPAMAGGSGHFGDMLAAPAMSGSNRASNLSNMSGGSANTADLQKEWRSVKQNNEMFVEQRRQDIAFMKEMNAEDAQLLE